MRSIFAFIVCACLLTGCFSGSTGPKDYTSSFHLDVTADILETLDGNSFVAHVQGVHPVFGRALKIKVRGLSAESITVGDSRKSSLAFRQWHKFRQLLKESKTVELRNLERGDSGFWVWADVYLDGEILEDRNG